VITQHWLTSIIVSQCRVILRTQTSMQTLINRNNSTLSHIKRSNSIQSLINRNTSTQTSSQLHNLRTVSDEPQQRSPEFNQSLPYLARLSISTLSLIFKFIISALRLMTFSICAYLYFLQCMASTQGPDYWSANRLKFLEVGALSNYVWYGSMVSYYGYSKSALRFVYVV